MNAGRAVLTVRTAALLRPAQLAHRVRLRAQRAALARWPSAGRRVLTTPPRPAAGWPAGFSPVDARVPGEWPSYLDLRDGRITLLGRTGRVTEPGDWAARGAPRLWRYHLHYWDWASALAGHENRADARAVFAGLWRRWRAGTPFGLGDAWSPYVASLRAWSWCSIYSGLVEHTSLAGEFLDELWSHLCFLRAHVERDVGGNHLVKNLKALAGLAVFFSDGVLLHRTLDALGREVGTQVLPDGGHFERAPAYHCQVLGDLADVAGLLAAAGRRPPAWLSRAIARMRGFLGLVLLPDGTVPLLNDGFPVPAARVAALRPGPPAPAGITSLSDSGLVVLRAGGLFVLADVGDPCPDELPAHAHADTLSFLLYDGTRRIVTEAGTSTYTPGPRRDFERSTAGHSTVEIDGANSTEVWGAFRAARRARVLGVAARDTPGALTLRAAHDGYRRRPGGPIHRRTWRLDPHRLTVRDEILGRGRHDIAVRVLLATGVRPAEAARFGPQWTSTPVDVATGWDTLSRATQLATTTSATLPWTHEFHYHHKEQRAGVK